MSKRKYAHRLAARHEAIPRPPLVRPYTIYLTPYGEGDDPEWVGALVARIKTHKRLTERAQRFVGRGTEVPAYFIQRIV